jgi:hypothetical protein
MVSTHQRYEILAYTATKPLRQLYPDPGSSASGDTAKVEYVTQSLFSAVLIHPASLPYTV